MLARQDATDALAAWKAAFSTVCSAVRVKSRPVSTALGGDSYPRGFVAESRIGVSRSTTSKVRGSGLPPPSAYSRGDPGRARSAGEILEVKTVGSEAT
jgi:hypothetical protein